MGRHSDTAARRRIGDIDYYDYYFGEATEPAELYYNTIIWPQCLILCHAVVLTGSHRSMLG